MCKIFRFTEFEDIGKNGQVEDEIDTILQVTSHIEQQNATDNDENPATPPVGDVASYPTRICNKPTYLDEYVVDSTTNLAVDYCYQMNDIPTCYSQAVNAPDSSGWKRAMDEEMNSLESNDTFTFTPLPPTRDVVGGKLVYTIKSGPNN